MAQVGKLRTLEGGKLAFWCVGCKEAHALNSIWTFNGDYDKPTFSPSVLVTSGHYCNHWKQGDNCWCTYNAEHINDPAPFKCTRCHSFVTDGVIQYLNDCTHEYAGKSVPLESF